VGPGRSDAGDVCGEEVDAVSVEVAAGAVVVLGGSGVRVAGEDLGVTQGDAGVQGVGDRGYLPSIMKRPWSQPVSVYEARKARKAKNSSEEESACSRPCHTCLWSVRNLVRHEAPDPRFRRPSGGKGRGDNRGVP
jgi:hypothetical protein